MNIILMGMLVALSIALIVYSFWPKSGEEGSAIKRRMSGKKDPSKLESAREKAKASVAQRVMERVAPMAVRPSDASNVEGMSKLRQKLSTAGLRSENAATMLLASKSFVAVALGIAGLGFAWMKQESLLNVAGIVLLCAGGGFLAPNIWLAMAISKRKEKVRNGLADSLDMLVISVESGLGLDAAFQRVGDEMRPVHPELSEELQLVTRESQMGIPRAEALTNMNARTGIDEVQSLVAIINQAERFGTSIARALRNQSDALRMKRRQAAEERAQKTTVKLMAPLILFIFPAILVVLAGPAALKMIEALGGTNLTGG